MTRRDLAYMTEQILRPQEKTNRALSNLFTSPTSTSQPYLPQSKKANIPQMPFFKPPSYMEKKKDMRAETKRNIAENQTLLPRLLHRLLL